MPDDRPSEEGHKDTPEHLGHNEEAPRFNPEEEGKEKKHFGTIFKIIMVLILVGLAVYLYLNPGPLRNMANLVFDKFSP
ncbi:hypothetical protein HYU13_04835 [Candidatus Woesearchaeota archaeon]|nr:hypothetical protein [Candidatus Woesearchaeota archaeon]